MGKRTRSYDNAGAVKGFRKIKNGIELTLDKGTAQVFFYTPEIARIRYTRGEGTPEDSWAVDKRKLNNVKLSFESDDLEFVLQTSALSLHVNKDPMRVVVYDRSRRLLSQDAEWGGCGFKGSGVFCEKSAAGNERFYGFGEKTFNIDRSGSKMTMWNTDYPFHKRGSDPLYITVPFFIGLHSGAAYGVFFDNTWKSFFDLKNTKRGHYTFGAEGGDLDYYFIAGPDMKDVIERFTWLTGRMPMPPRWALGHHQSRWSYKNEDKIRKITGKFREFDIPTDAVHLDIHYMDSYKVFTWDNSRFPDPSGLLDDIAGKGFRTITIIDPGVKISSGYEVYEEGLEDDLFCRDKSGTGYFRGVVWPGETVFPDFSRKEVRDWWAGLIKSFISEYGISGIWNDMNEPSVNIKQHIRKIVAENIVHGERGKDEPHLKLRNVYGLGEAMATRDGQLAARPGERPFLLTRSGYAGIQKYAAVWSGDNSSSWEQFKLSIPLLCGLGLSGVPFVGADIGGFGGNCTPELYARWIQAGVFYPFCRSHSMLASRPQEPWSFGPRVTKIAREYIKLRYSLMPYIYNSFRQSAETGLPVMRPLALDFMNDEPCLTIEDEFMFGASLLVAPVMEPGAKSRVVYLPPGSWVDFHTGRRYGAGGTVVADAPLEKIPVFIRSGHIIPSVMPYSYEGDGRGAPLIVNVERGADATLSLYEDDGISFDYERGKYSVGEYSYEESDGECVLRYKKVKSGYEPARNAIVFKLRGVASFPEEVALNGKKIYESWSGNGDRDYPLNGWRFTSNNGVLSVGFPAGMDEAEIRVVF